MNANHFMVLVEPFESPLTSVIVFSVASWRVTEGASSSFDSSASRAASTVGSASALAPSITTAPIRCCVFY